MYLKREHNPHLDKDEKETDYGIQEKLYFFQENQNPIRVEVQILCFQRRKNFITAIDREKN